MAGRGSRGTQRTKTDVERARLYAARSDWNKKQTVRRRRDTVIASVVGGVIVIGAIASQTVHAQITAPTPTPSAPVQNSSTPEPTPPVGQSPAPTQTPGE